MKKHFLTNEISTLLAIEGLGISVASRILEKCGGLEGAKKPGSKLDRGRIKGISKEKATEIFKLINA